MTANQINYQKAKAEIEERAQKAQQLRLENEMTDLANRQEKFWHYGISDPNDPTINKAFITEAYDRGLEKAGKLLGLFGSAAGLGNIGVSGSKRRK